ncbi:ACP phosphodiesterase, partial [Microscilla marina]
MNFLAHTFLSGKSEEILIGNFIADFLKGNQF